MADGGQLGQALVPAGGAQAGSALERVGALARDVRGRFLAMPAGRRTWLGASALLVAAICAGMMWYAGRPLYLISVFSTRRSACAAVKKPYFRV